MNAPHCGKCRGAGLRRGKGRYAREIEMLDRVRRVGGGKYHNGLVGPGETIAQRRADSLRFRDRRRTQNDGNCIVGRTSSTLSSTSRKYSDFTPASVTSMGFRSSTASGIFSAFRRPAVIGSGAGVSNPARPAASATKLAAPPVEVTTAMRRPFNRRPELSASGISSRSEKCSALMMPSCLNNAS